MKKQTFLLLIIIAIVLSTNAQNGNEKQGVNIRTFDPVIILDPIDSLDCINYDFEAWQWFPYQIDAEVQNADAIQWTTSGDGTFSDVNIVAPQYYIGKDDLLNNSVILTITATGNSITETAEIALGIPLQLIPFTKEGWTGLSSFVDKSGVSVPEVMAPVVNHLIIMVNEIGQSYWPEPIPPINNIGNWSAVGYQAKFINTPACLPVYGSAVEDQSVFAEGSFIFLPVLTDYPVAIEDLLGENAEKVLLIYDWKDSLTWTPASPEFDYLNPGMAYNMILNVGESFTVQFPPYSWEDPVSGKTHPASEIELFPNPSNGVFKVKLADKFQNFEFDVFNMQGVSILKGKSGEDFSINISTHPKGIYFLKISFEDTKLIKKIVVQ